MNATTPTIADQRAAARAYRVPRITHECDPVSLSEFSVSEIRDYLRHMEKNGAIVGPDGECSEDGALIFEEEFLDRIETLALCGQAEHARSEVLRLVGDYIGRSL